MKLWEQNTNWRAMIQDLEEEVFKEAVELVLAERFPEIESLTDTQSKALFSFVSGKDVLAIWLWKELDLSKLWSQLC